jgi:hypothetical protein
LQERIAEIAKPAKNRSCGLWVIDQRRHRHQPLKVEVFGGFDSRDQFADL